MVDERDIDAGERALGDEAHVAVGQTGLSFGHADAGVHAEVLAFFIVRGVVAEVLGGDDLVGVDVVAEDEGGAGDSGHGGFRVWGFGESRSTIGV